ncbi:hypothetical protein QJQ45_011656 [Haematococcus lacustris]|nr:hypothetical protein QJQ45_011656 [Haematococcus lacustris]
MGGGVGDELGGGGGGGLGGVSAYGSVGSAYILPTVSFVSYALCLNMQRIGESRWRPLELCYWPDQGALPAKGKEYPGLGYKRVRDKPPKAQEHQQPAEAQ